MMPAPHIAPIPTARARYKPPQRRQETRAPQQKGNGALPGAAPTPQLVSLTTIPTPGDAHVSSSR